jgi:carbonic anhydrase
MGTTTDELEKLEINNPYKAVEIEVAALRANPNVPGGYTVSGLVNDVATGKVERIVPPSRLRPDAG